MKKYRAIIALLAVLTVFAVAGCNEQQNVIEKFGDIEITKIEFNGSELAGLDLTKDTVTMPDLEVSFVSKEGGTFVDKDAVFKIYMRNKGDGEATPGEMKFKKNSGDWAAYFTDGTDVAGVLSGSGYSEGKIQPGGEAVVTFTLTKTSGALTAGKAVNAQLTYNITLSAS